MNRSVLAFVLAASSGGGSVAFSIVALVAIMVVVGLVRGRIRRARNRLLSAGVKKAATAITNHADKTPGSQSGASR
jgi:Flp pilus assembly protein TadG